MAVQCFKVKTVAAISMYIVLILCLFCASVQLVKWQKFHCSMSHGIRNLKCTKTSENL